MHKRDQKRSYGKREDRAFEGSATREVEERVMEVLTQDLVCGCGCSYCVMVLNAHTFEKFRKHSNIFLDFRFPAIRYEPNPMAETSFFEDRSI